MSDLVVTVRQISNYPAINVSSGLENVLVQQGGAGAPYASIPTANLVATALNDQGAMGIGMPLPEPPPAPGQLFAAGSVVFPAPGGGPLYNLYFDSADQLRYLNTGVGAAVAFENGTFVWQIAPVGAAGQLLVDQDLTELLVLNVAGAMDLPNGTLSVARDPATPFEVATLNYVSNNTVHSFNNRIGRVQLNSTDVYNALQLDSPIATQTYVQQAIFSALTTGPIVATWNGRTGNVYLNLSDITCVFFQPGQQPIAPTPPPGSNDYSIATTQFVTEAVQGDAAFLPVSGGTMDGPLHMATNPFDNASADGNDTALITPNWTPCWPVGNSPDPSTSGTPAIQSQFVVQAQSKSDHTISEGTGVFGLYVNTGTPNGQKFALYSGAVQGPLGGATWALNSLIVRNGVPGPLSNVPGGPSHIGSSTPGTPGAMTAAQSTIGFELDFTNWDQDCAPGGPFAVGMYIANQSLFASLAGIYYGSNPQNAGHNNYAWHNGIEFSGPYTIQDAAILDASNSANVLRVSGTHFCVVDVLTFSPTFTGPMWNGNFTATSINNTPIGGTTASTGAFTTLSATGAVSGVGFTNLFASPPAIGSTTAAAGTFTTVTTSGNIICGNTFEAAGTGTLYLGNSRGASVMITDPGGPPANVLQLQGNITGFGPVIEIAGSDTNVNLNIYAKGTGAIWLQSPVVTGGTNGQITVGSSGPTIRSGTGAATGTQPKGSIWIRTDGAAGSTLYVTQGGGTWNAVAGV